MVRGVGLEGVLEPVKQEATGSAIKIGHLLFAEVNTNKFTCRSSSHTCSDPPCPCAEIINGRQEKGHRSITEQNTPPYIEDIMAVIR